VGKRHKYNDARRLAVASMSPETAATAGDALVGEAAADESAGEPTIVHGTRGRVDTSLAPFELLIEYEQRSLAHVVGLPEQLDAPGLWRGVGFRIGHKRLASGFDEVVEIMPMPQVTPVPGAQPWMLGVANIRGNLLPIVDLKQFLEGERTVLHEGQRVLIVRQPGGDVAVTIDELYGQRSFNDEQQIPMDALSESTLAEGRYAHFVDRAYRLAEDAWGIFSLERLARTPEFRQAAA
jgi:twitching motility protein PilI